MMQGLAYITTLEYKKYLGSSDKHRLGSYLQHASAAQTPGKNKPIEVRQAVRFRRMDWAKVPHLAQSQGFEGFRPEWRGVFSVKPVVGTQVGRTDIPGVGRTEVVGQAACRVLVGTCN